MYSKAQQKQQADRYVLLVTLDMQQSLFPFSHCFLSLVLLQETTRCRSSNFIPDDEATLMKNGSCLVCSHRPVFDTVDMLMVHRKGKRHLEGTLQFSSSEPNM
uniref:Sodium channel modifier 1 zinc-finger domain-containing protein n=1 Tax=Cyprinus carpio carpio TaxID=630221 RepID=A0A9J8BTA5_CYPCA